MKNNIPLTIIICAASLLFSGCLDDTFPTEYAGASQIGASEQALEALSNSTIAFMYAYNYFDTHYPSEFGYPAMMIMRDALTDCSYVSTNNNHFTTPWVSLMRMYEYKTTGVAALDAQADRNEIWGLTAVIVDEHSDGRDADNNPRAPYYVMYRFILNDLNRAEIYLDGYNRPAKNRPDQSVVHALKARLWLEIATRLQRYPDDLQTLIIHETDNELAEKYPPLHIASALECYQKAAEYARKVIDKYTPLTQAQWHSVTNGFNDMSVPAWVFAISVNTPNAVYTRLNNFLSHCVTEYSRGYSRSQYHCYRMIDKRLYDKIDDEDWRKVTWKDPADFDGRPAAGADVEPVPPQYYTLFRGTTPSIDGNTLDWEWRHRDPYVGFKFRPKGGDISENWRNAQQVDYPLIRVEEMYFIEVEAKAYTDGLAAGIDALTSFLNTHRYRNGSYSIAPTDIDDFVDNYLITQKRIELWGEGLSYFDIKRRALPLVRGYDGTNWLASRRFNSIQGYTPAWLNYYIPIEGEASLNSAIRLNPDPMVLESYGLWVN